MEVEFEDEYVLLCVVCGEHIDRKNPFVPLTELSSARRSLTLPSGHRGIQSEPLLLITGGWHPDCVGRPVSQDLIQKEIEP